MPSSRKHVRKLVEDRVLTRSRRICALCYGLRGGVEPRDGQIAHVDRDNSNSDEENLAWLCLKHHSRYDSTSRQAKSFTPGELRSHRDQLYRDVDEGVVGQLARMRHEHRNRAVRDLTQASLEVFDRRFALYTVVRDFVDAVVSKADVSYDDLKKMSARMDEVLFVCDEPTWEYTWDLYRRGVRLMHVHRRLVNEGERIQGEAWEKLTNEEADLLQWFSKQVNDCRTQFKRLLRLPTP